MITSRDVFHMVADEDVAEATTGAYNVLGQKVLQSLENRKINLAATLFQNPTASETESK